MTIKSYEHVGIRVSNREESVAFYEKLGFKEKIDLPDQEANEMESESGVMINLIFNGIKHEDHGNILMDAPIKYTGVTHPAFIVDSLSKMLDICKKHEIKITEGPLELSGRRQVFFIRDPDGTVLEFDELY